MFNKQLNINQKNLLLTLYIVILGIFVPAIYWMSNTENKSNDGRNIVKNPIEKRISVGDKILVTARSNEAKQAGVEAFAEENYIAASESFESALKSNRNDPETLIYLNNALAARTKDPHRIAVSVPIGGDLDVAQEILRGVAQAQDEVNRGGGINGKLVTVEIANDDNDAEIGLKIADKLIKDKQTVAVVGHNSSNVSTEVAPLYQKEELVMITPTSSAESIPKVGDYIFRSTPSTRGLAQPLADYAVNTLGKTNIAICFDSESKSIESFKNEFTWSVFDYGGKIAPVECDFSAPGFIAEQMPSQIVSSGADALLIAPSLRKIDEAIAVARTNDERLPLLGSHTLNTYSTLKIGQDATEGMTLAVAWNSLVEPQNEFNRHTQQLWGGSVNWRTAMAYDAAKTIFEGLEVNDSREGLQQVLSNPNFIAEGATSTVSFLPSGDRNLQGTLIEVQPGERSGTGYDFIPLSSTTSLSN